MTADAPDRKRRVSAERLLSHNYVRECFELRGAEIYWRNRPVEHFADEHAWKVFQSKYAGKPAGRKELNGYISIHMRYRGERLQFQAHRVVWFLHYGEWPRNHIDHINRIRADNRIENLRDVLPVENVKNAENKRVFRLVAPYYHGRFVAQVGIGGVRSVHIGIFDTEAEALEYRAMVCDELEKVARALAKKTPKPSKYRRRAQPEHTERQEI